MQHRDPFIKFEKDLKLCHGGFRALHAEASGALKERPQLARSNNKKNQNKKKESSENAIKEGVLILKGPAALSSRLHFSEMHANK